MEAVFVSDLVGFEDQTVDVGLAVGLDKVSEAVVVNN